MRLIVFFDLPTLTAADRKNYRKFRKGLLESGFFMLQESVYCRMVLNQSIERSAIAAVERIKPPDGIVQILSVTEKQFSKMQYLVGTKSSEVIDTDERVIIL